MRRPSSFGAPPLPAAQPKRERCGFQWGVYVSPNDGFYVERYRGTKGLVAVAITRGLAQDFADAQNKYLDGVRAAADELVVSGKGGARG